MPELMMPADRAEEIDMRTFDLDKTYYLNSALDAGVNEELATLPLYAPVTVMEVYPDHDGEVWVRSKRDRARGGYVLARAILDDIPGAADLREAKEGDRVMILKACGIEDHVQRCPFGIVTAGQYLFGRLLFRFEDGQEGDYHADEWTLDIQDAEAEETPEESVGDVAGNLASLSASLDRAILDDIPGAPDSGYRKGDKVRVKEAVYYAHDARIRQPNVEVGKVYEVDRLPGDWGLAKGEDRYGNLTVLPGYYLALDAIELDTVDPAEGAPEETVTRSDTELSASLDRAEKARQAAMSLLAATRADLESLEELVRESATYQYQSKRWELGHVNDFLESLGLDPIKPAYDGPVSVGSTIKLNDGRIAVICDTSDEPFRAFYPNAEGYEEWLSVADVVSVGVEREVHDNEPFSELYIKV